MRTKKIVIGSTALLVIVFLAFVIKERAFSYNYDNSADYSYSFDSSYAKIVSVAVKNSIIQLPQFDSSYNTALIEIELQQNIVGYILQPEIKMLYDTLYLSQDFEYGAEGTRYLNVSAFIQNNSKKITLDCYRCSIADGTYKLIMYKNRDIKKERVLVLSPHPDDAEIAAYGLYSSTKNTFIATITAGDAGKSKYENFYNTDSAHYLQKGKLRAWNSITVPLLADLNPQNIVNLGYFDSSLKLMYFNDTLTATSKFIGTKDIYIFRSKNISAFLNSIKAGSNWCSLVNDLKYILQKRNPTLIVTPYPAIDTHYDHKCTSLALFQAMKELHYTDAELWMYTNHYFKSDLYPVGEMGSATSLPPHFKTPRIYFDKIYSHPLSKDVQIDKLFALDAMNDLRHNTEWNTIGDLFQILFKKITDNLFQYDNSYYRKSVRSNELFFVVKASNIYDDANYKKIVGDINQIGE
jgi:LmbE family N-acetylglucosaminyl deacetylase